MSADASLDLGLGASLMRASESTNLMVAKVSCQWPGTRPGLQHSASSSDRDFRVTGKLGRKAKRRPLVAQLKHCGPLLPLLRTVTVTPGVAPSPLVAALSPSPLPRCSHRDGDGLRPPPPLSQCRGRRPSESLARLLDDHRCDCCRNHDGGPGAAMAAPV
jgi:hypothetical protein